MASLALDHITVQGYKSIASIEKLPLRPINVLIGPNGSGKSNFIGVFSLLHAIREGRLRDSVTEARGAEKILHFGSKTTKEIRLLLSFENEVNQYELTLSPTSDDGLFPSSESTYFWDKEDTLKSRTAKFSPPESKGERLGLATPLPRALQGGCETDSAAGAFTISTTPARPLQCGKRQSWTITISCGPMVRIWPPFSIICARNNQTRTA